MKRDFLNDLLKDVKEEDRKGIVDKIMAENGADIEAAKGDTKKLEDDVKTLKAEKKTLEGQIATANSTIEDLKKSNPDVEGLQKKITDYETQIKEDKANYEKELTNLRREAIATAVLGKYKAKNAKSVKALIDEFEAKDDQDFETLFESRVKALSEAEDTKFLFGETKIQTPYNPTGGGEPGKEGLGASMAAQRNATQAPAFDPWATK